MTRFTLFEHWFLILSGYFLRILYVWFNNRPPKLITRDVFKSKYTEIQQFHLEKFKKLINEKLKSAITKGQTFPIYVDYNQQILSEESTNKLRDYVMFTLKFGDFEIDQKGCIDRLILKG